MTPDEIINNVCEEYERPDMVYKLSNKFPFCVRSAHSVERFARDMTEASLVGFSINTSDPRNPGLVQVTQDDNLPRCREVRYIIPYRTYTEPSPGVIIPGELIPGVRDFVPTHERVAVRDIYGYIIPNTFSQLGNVLSITGVDTNATCLVIGYLSFPNTFFSSEEDSWMTDSWILRDFPELIAAYLGRELAKMVDSRTMLSSAMDKLSQTRADFIDVYSHQVLKPI